VPLVYRVSFLGKLVVPPVDAGDAEPLAEVEVVADDDGAVLFVELLLLHALAVPSASTAMAAEP
jgi:hypothetical protein